MWLGTSGQMAIGGQSRRSKTGGPKRSKIGCSGGCPGATKIGQSWSKKSKFQSLGVFQKRPKLKLLCEMSIQSRLFLGCLKKQNGKIMCFRLGPVLCICNFQPSKCVLRGGKTDLFEHFGTSGRWWGPPAKLCVSQNVWSKKTTGAAQHDENTSNKPHVVGTRSQSWRSADTAGDQNWQSILQRRSKSCCTRWACNRSTIQKTTQPTTQPEIKNNNRRSQAATKLANGAVQPESKLAVQNNNRRTQPAINFGNWRHSRRSKTVQNAAEPAIKTATKSAIGGHSRRSKTIIGDHRRRSNSPQTARSRSRPQFEFCGTFSISQDEKGGAKQQTTIHNLVDRGWVGTKPGSTWFDWVRAGVFGQK